MLNICSTTIVRDGDDVIELCLSSVLPYVTRAIVTVDDRSKDDTLKILHRMQARFSNLEVDTFHVTDPLTDLVEIRNRQLARVKEQLCWIVDSDEYYFGDVVEDIQDEVNKTFNWYDVYALRCWAPWDRMNGHKSSSKAVIPRIFKMKPSIKWKGRFGNEMLYNGSSNIFLPSNPHLLVLPYRYIHFTHLKKDPWRKELHRERVADDKFLYPLGMDITHVIDKFYENQNHQK